MNFAATKYSVCAVNKACNNLLFIHTKDRYIISLSATLQQCFFSVVLFNDSNTTTQLQLNMEVELQPKQIPNLKEFISHLSLTTHSSVPGSLVIW